jgi:RNA polymerase sigma-70 factor (ECF subfamily)
LAAHGVFATDLAQPGQRRPTGARVRPSDDFQDFYLASYGRTVAMLAPIAGNKPEAEDIAQEAYARALARWSRLRNYDLPEAWVRKVALRLAIDSGRRLRRSLGVSARIAAQRQPPGPEPSDDLRYTALGAALMDLPLRERQVVVMHYLADLPIDAIATECGLPAGTVKTRLAAGRKQLEQRLTQQPEAVA